MENTNALPKILDRIQKLLALATSSNTNEAASAAAKAAQMMAQYELEEADLRIASGLNNSDPIDTEGFLDDGPVQRINQWETVLTVAICKSFGIHSWFHVSKVYATDAFGNFVRDRHGRRKIVTKNRIRVVGRQDKVRTARYLLAYLITEINRICDEEWAKDLDAQSKYHGKSWKTTFKICAANAVYKRLMEQKAANDAVNCKAMVLVRKDQEEVDRAFKDLNLRLYARQQSPVYRNGNAEAKGRECGESLNLAGGGKGLGAPTKQICG